MINKAIVKKIKASGVVVSMNGKDAWLPGQELSSLYNSSISLAKQKLCSEGQELEVIAYDKEVGGKKLVVSHTRVHNDPEEKIKHWKVGDLKEFKVTSVTPTRAFGIIEAGIVGYIKLSEVYKHFDRDWRHFRTIVAGDIVAGYIESKAKDKGKWLVKLDMVSYIRSIKEIPDQLPVLRKYQRNYIGDEELITGNFSNTTVASSREMQRILLVDNSKLLVTEVSNYLEDCGIEVTAAHLEEEARKLLDEDAPDFDIAVLDLHLTNTSDFGGMEIARLIGETQPRCRIIFITGDEFGLENLIKSNDELIVSYILYKPFSLKELDDAISTAMNENPKPLGDFFSERVSDLAFQPPSISDPHSILSIIKNLKNDVNAESVVLFGIHPLSLEVKIVEKYGFVPANADHDLPRFRYSPVKDVALDNETFFEGMVGYTNRYPKHRWLYKTFKYASCIACPVNVTHEWAFALFVFHRLNKKFNKEAKFIVKSASGEIARSLELERMQEMLICETPFIIAGKTYGNMAHELLNVLSKDFAFYSINRLLDSNPKSGSVRITQIKKHLSNLQVGLKKANEIVKTFRRMSTGQHEEEAIVDIYDVIREVCNNIGVEAKASKIFISIPEDKPASHQKVRMRRTAFEQVIYNLTFNAVQQIQNFKFFRRKGVIKVEIEVAMVEGRQQARILIHDNGPGIHACNFQEVFKKGYSTKVNGCGMGLDICRGIVKQADGKIKILKSVLFAGTTFEIIVPITNVKESE